MSKHTEEKLDKYRQDRREFLKKARAVGLVAPAVATFSMSGLMSRAHAQVHSNLSK